MSMDSPQNDHGVGTPKTKSVNRKSRSGQHPGQVRGRSHPYEWKKSSNNPMRGGRMPADVPRGYVKKVGPNPGVKNKGLANSRKTGV